MSLQRRRAVEAPDGARAPDERVPERCLVRLRWYLQAVDEGLERGSETISSDEIGRRVGVKPNLVRSDLSWFGEFGTRSRGYDLRLLRDEIRRICNLDQSRPAVWIGLRFLLEQPRTLANLEQYNWRVVSVIDWDDQQVGARIGRRRVDGRGDLPYVVERHHAHLGIVATEAGHAQEAADALVAAGIRAVLNLTPVVLVVPDEVELRDACAEDAIFALSYYCKQPAA